MDQIGQFLSQYATKEVITVAAAVLAAYCGWKAAKGAYGVVAGFAKKASFMGLTSAVMLAAGMGAVGLSFGEFSSRPASKSDKPIRIGISDGVLSEIVRDEDAKPEAIMAIMKYAEHRDQQQMQMVDRKANQAPLAYELKEVKIDPVDEAAAKAEESIMTKPTAGGIMGLGFATIIAACAVYFNRHSRRNPEDPHYAGNGGPAKNNPYHV